MRALGTNAIVVELTNEMHGASAAFWDFVTLNPDRHAKLAKFFRSGRSNNFDDIRIVLGLAKHEFTILEPNDLLGNGMKTDDHISFPRRAHFESVLISDDKWAAELIRNGRN